MKALVGESLEMLEAATRLAADATGDIAVPGLTIGLKALAEILKKHQTMQTTVEGVETLKERVASLLAGLEEFRRQCPNQKLPEGMRPRLEALGRLWEDIGQRAAKIKNRGRVRRFLTSDKDARKLSGLIGEINDSIQDRIVIQGILNVENYVHEIRKDVKAIKAFLHVEFLPRHAKMAHYSSNSVRRSCLEGTRVDFLQEIYIWIDAARAQGFAVPYGGIVLWINGLGGTGKTTVAFSVAERCDGLEILGGSFFCSRSDAECSDPNLIFVTLCRHLCDHHAPFKTEVEGVLERNPKVVDEGLYRQFEELIVRPLEVLGPAFPRSAFVLDALDECKDKGAKSIILSVIAKFVSRVAKFLLFIITSRPEEHITALFKASRRDSLNDTTTPLLLHDVPIDVVIGDIRRYVDYEFEDNIGVLSIESGWPSNEEKNRLAELSHGLFIHVVTAIKFIMDRAYGNPKGQLSSLLHPQSKSSTPQEFLRALYSTILAASYERASPDLLNTIRDVLGTVVLAQEPLSPSSVSSLLGIGEDIVRNALTRLHSVLHVPTESAKPIRIIHPTFPEFLLEPSNINAIKFEGFQPQSPPTTLHLQPTLQHRLLFSRCLLTMFVALKRDIIGIRYPTMFQSEDENLQGKVDAAIKPHVRYVCRFWGVHFRDGVGSAALEDLDPFRDFLRKTLLFWLEACSLSDAMDKAVFAIDTAQAVCQTSP